ncbi:MAG: SUF system NifU family Fe-S cluster assembly protein [Bacilli bacterium]
MPISISPEMMREIIMDHYNTPNNKKTPAEPKDFQVIHMDSTSCIDDIYVYVKLKNDIIDDICFDGVACAIATSSTDIMCDLMRGKTKAEANYIITQYKAMINEEKYDDSVLDEALVFINTSKQAARIKCATIGWNALTELIK